MANAYSMEDVLDFLGHASGRGLMPAATATALGVAVRNVFGVLGEDEQKDVGRLDVEEVVKRFTNKRARDFSPSSLKEYGRRVQRAIDLFETWRADAANFTVKTRATNANGKRQRNKATSANSPETPEPSSGEPPPSAQGGYPSSIPIRADWIVTITNIPVDLTRAEAERLASFIKMLAVE